MPIDVVELTRELVRIPSVNPMGHSVSGEIYLETRLTDFLENRIRELGFPTERHPVLPGRDNLITRVEGRGKLADKLIMLEVHQDTVPVDGMTIPPFDAPLRSGRIWGRGSCDVKGGMATLLATLVQLNESTAKDLPTVAMAMTINEENGFDGIHHLSRLWQAGDSVLLPRAPDAAIITEPSELDVIVAHKGAVRWHAHANGRAAHSSNPSAGKNAIYGMAKLINGLEEYAERGLPTTEHPLVGRATLSIGTIHGGVSVNTVPDRCTIEVDRRLLPDESPEVAMNHVLNYLNDRGLTEGFEHDPPFLASSGLASDANNQSLADAFAARCRKHWERYRQDMPECRPWGEQLGVPFGTDAGVTSAAGVPAIVFGPGSIQQAHTKDEWIDATMLGQAVDILTDFCQNPIGAID